MTNNSIEQDTQKDCKENIEINDMNNDMNNEINNNINNDFNINRVNSAYISHDKENNLLQKDNQSIKSNSTLSYNNGGKINLVSDNKKEKVIKAKLQKRKI